MSDRRSTPNASQASGSTTGAGARIAEEAEAGSAEKPVEDVCA